MSSLPTTIILATGNPHKVAELRAIFAGGAAGSSQINVLGLTDLPFHAQLHEPEEHGTTFEENARIKALSYATQIAALSAPQTRIPNPDSRIPTSFLTLADDSGLEIDALNGRPGVISSHYSTDGVETGMTRPERDAANNTRVLRELESVPVEKRTARFVCCMCLAGMRGQGRGPRAEEEGRASGLPSALGPEPCALVLHTTRGTFEGRIGLPPRIPAGNNGFGYDPLFLVAPEYTRTGAELSSEVKNTLSHRGAAARAMAEWIHRSIHPTRRTAG